MIIKTIQLINLYFLYIKGEISEEYMIWSIDYVKIVLILMWFLLLLYFIINNKKIHNNNNINKQVSNIINYIKKWKLGIWISILVIIQILILILWIEVYIKNDNFNIEILDNIYNLGIIIDILQWMLILGMYVCINIIFKKVGILLIWNEIGQNMLKRINIFFENVCYNWAVFLYKSGVYEVKNYELCWMKIWKLCRWSELFIKLFIIWLLLILLLFLIVVLIMESCSLVLVLVIPLVWMCVKLLRLIIYKIKEEWKYYKDKEKDKDKHKDIIVYNNKMIFGHNIKNIKSIGKNDIYIEIQGNNHKNKKSIGNKNIYIEILGNNHYNIKSIGNKNIYIEILGNNHKNKKSIGNKNIYIEILGNKRNYSTSNKDLNNDNDGGLISCISIQDKENKKGQNKDGGLISSISIQDKECMSINPNNIDQKEIEDLNSWLAGLIDAEGSWFVRIMIDLTRKNCIDINVGFNVTMHKNEKGALVRLQKAMGGVGKIRSLEKYNTIKYEVNGFNDIKNIIVPFLKKHNANSSKQHTLKAYIEVVELMTRKEHLKAEGVAKIIRIVYDCHWITSNRFYTKEELLSVIGDKERGKELKEYKKQYEKEKKGVLIDKEVSVKEKKEAAISLSLNDAVKLRRFGEAPKDLIIYSNEHIYEYIRRKNYDYLRQPVNDQFKYRVAGTIEGDGSWPISLSIDLKSRLFVTVHCSFMLTQHYICVDMLKQCQHAISASYSISNEKADNLKSNNYKDVAIEETRLIGRIVSKGKTGNVLDYRVDKHEDICIAVIPFLKQYTRFSCRQNSLNAFYKVSKLIYEKQHLNPEGLAQIIDIVYDNPGNGPERPYTRKELKSAIGNKEIAKKLYENNIRKKAEKKKQGIEEEEEQEQE